MKEIKNGPGSSLLHNKILNMHKLKVYEKNHKEKYYEVLHNLKDEHTGLS